MKKVWLLATILVLLITILGAAGCDKDERAAPEPPTEVTPTPPTAESGFNMIFKYGPSIKNNLDTFKGTFTKDMFNDPSITIEFPLTEKEKESIYLKMLEIDFFDYPDEFYVREKLYDGDIPPGVVICNKYYFYVEYDSQVKELSWENCIPIPNFTSSTDNITNSDNIVIVPTIPDPEAIEYMENLEKAYRENNLYWIKTDEKADKLRELIKLIRDIIESKDEYKKLPEPEILYI